MKKLFASIALALMLASPALAARTNVTAQFTPSLKALPLSAGAATDTWTASDVTNGLSTKMTGRELLKFKNTDTISHTVTVSSVRDSQGRLSDITTYALPAAATCTFGPFPFEGWVQTDGNIYFTTDNVLVQVCVKRLSQ